MNEAPANVLASKIPDHLQRRQWSTERLLHWQRDALASVLSNALERSPFHARRLRGIDPARIDPRDLSSLPTMTKDEMMAAYDDVVTDRRVTRAGLEAHLAGIGDEPSLFLDEFLVLASGGSSGVRGMFAYTVDSAAEYLAAGIRATLARMLEAGSATGAPPGIAMVAAHSAVHATRALARMFSGDLLQVTSISATRPLREIVAELERVQPGSLQGYPTVVAQLADERAAGRLSISPAALTTSSEPLTADLRARIERGFGVPVVDQFGASEGLMGSGKPGSDWIAMPADLAILEFVDARNRPVPPGVESDKVLVTTLYNPVQPLVRYELTDRMTVRPEPAADGHPRVRVSGRSDDLLRYGDVSVHPHALRSVLVNTVAVREYRIRQTVRGVDVEIVEGEGARVDTGELGKRLEAALAGCGLEGAVVSATVVADLPRHADTAKMRRVVPLA